ncbi:MAG: mevalonate kinase [Anaerolineae bacterium]
MVAHYAEGSAPGKVIVCGEHSVVYGRPAIAVPVSDLRARARVEAAPPGSGFHIVAVDLDEALALDAAPPDHPLAVIVRLTLTQLQLDAPDAVLTVRSDLPIGAGLGSGAAVSVAVVRALTVFLERELDVDVISALTYEVEKIHHGTPSGIDNTVVAWERPVYFVRGTAPEVFTIGAPLHLLIADSGIGGSTREAVAGVRRRREQAREVYEARFDRMGAVAEAARQAIERGERGRLGALLDENHALLQEIGVSIPALDRLVAAARGAGALGAKLTGAGVGGNVIALAPRARVESIRRALDKAGAVRVWQTTVGG